MREMVLKRKLDCLSVGFDFSNIPKAPRSCRRKVISKKTDGDGDGDDATHTCAIGLLALAGQLLQESESSSASSNNVGKEIKQEEQEDVKCKPIKSESSDQRNSLCVVNSFSLPDSDKGLDRTPLSGCENKNVSIGFEQGEATDSLDMTTNDSFPRDGKNHTAIGRRDDDDDDNDEKFFSCNNSKVSNKFKSYRSSTIRRIRKPASYSKYWKQVSKDYGYSRADVGIKALYRKRKSCYGYGYNSHRREVIYKRRISSGRSSVVTSEGLSSGSVSKLPKKGDTVKLSIKSFRIPELLIEVPETATVGSLKRTVMEAVSVLLSGGIRVGVLVHGKKVRDDKKTLSQTGISYDDANLGFTLEPPGLIKDHVPLCSEDPFVPADSTNLSAGPLLLDSEVPVADDAINPGEIVDDKLEVVPYKSEISVDEPSVEVKALAVVPLNQKPKRTELSQRRTRRPFSVTEVESLVQAVEELGTGRWRDVKLRAFEDADHRTYVDLKDKWKTLVHTASISPQQRRGEPVPQELLDRVLRAYGYWSQYQGKHIKREEQQTKYKT